MNWYAVATLVSDALEEPVLLIGASGVVRLVNAALESLLGWTRDQLLGAPLTSVVPPHHHARLAALLDAGLQGARRTGEVIVTTASGIALVLTLELALVTDAGEAGLLGRVVASRPDDSTTREWSDATWLEVEVEGDFGRVGAVKGPGPQAVVGERCYRVVAGLDAPCPGCPLPNLPIGDTAEDLHVLPDERVMRWRALRVSRETARIEHTLMKPDVVNKLLRARLDAVATRCLLSDREREILDELVAGRTLEEIARVLRISPRTVRFHQDNVLAKLGIDSRLELMRLLLA